jgi:hypothetical protein
MSSFKSPQRRLVVGGRTFHFVAYEGQPASVSRKQAAEPSMWWLMVEGRRCPVTAFDPGQSDESVEQSLRQWLKENVLPAA